MYWGSFPGVKRPGRDFDLSLPTSTKIKQQSSYTSTPPYTFTARVKKTSLSRYFKQVIDKQSFVIRGLRPHAKKKQTRFKIT